ncbi:MAG: hypothetical protein LBP23_02865 [Treponema sp.]|nr:hypothetical protein [Treponema sp.]
MKILCAKRNKLPAACYTFARTAVLVFLLLPGVAFGTGKEGLPELLVRIFPGHAVAGAPWLLTILVDYPLPEEIEIRPPPLPEILTLDTTRRDLRFIRQPAGTGRRWTAVEYRFIPVEGGTARLGPFEIRGPWGSMTTSPVTVEIRTEENRGREKSGSVFSWRAPSELEAGERAFLDLVLVRGESPLPDPSLFVPEVPPGAILERELPDPPAGAFLRLSVVPLAPPLFNIPPYRVRYGHDDFVVPPLSIPVTAAGADMTQSSGDESGDSGPAASAGKGVPPRASPDPGAGTENVPPPAAFSFDRSRNVFLPLSGRYEGVLKKAEELIAAGDPVRALAELRRSERDSVAGPLFAAPRRELEQTMGLEDGGDEKWRPRAFFRALLGGCLATALPLLILRLKQKNLSQNSVSSGKDYGESGPKPAFSAKSKAAFPKTEVLEKPQKVTFFSPWGYRGIILILFAGAAAGLAGGRIRLPGIASRGTRSAVMRECAVRRIPDFLALESFRFAGGCPVRVRTVQGSWAWVEAGDGTEGAAGWAPLDDIVFYQD